MENNFTFNEKEHLYELDGKPLTGVTTILNVIAKPALIQWAASEAVNYVCNNIEELITATKERQDELLKEAKTAHRRKKEDAGQKGTDVHALIEERIKGAIKNNDGYFDPQGIDENTQVQHFLNWAIDNKVQFLESEKRMYSKEKWTAGTCDFTCVINGKRYVGDIKTGGVYDRIPHFQTAAYRMMLEEAGDNYEGSVIVNIKKDGKFNKEKDVYYSHDYQTDLEGFLAALKLYRILQNY